MSSNSVVVSTTPPLPGLTLVNQVNDALDSLKTGFSAATEPASPAAYQVWNDTGSGWVKQRNAANNAWNLLWKLDSQLSATTQATSDNSDKVATTAFVYSLSSTRAGRNLLPDGIGDFWYEGTTQSSSGYGSATLKKALHVGSAKTASQLALSLTDIPSVPRARFAFRTVVTSAAGASNFVCDEFPIESVRTSAGKTVVVSFFGKADASRPVAVELIQSFGTGGSPSTDVTGIGAQKITLSTSFTRWQTTAITLPILAGKTIGTNNNDALLLRVWYDAGTSFNARTNTLGQQSGTFDIACVQLEEGTIPTAFEELHQEVAQARVERLYQDYSNLFVLVQTADATFVNSKVIPKMRATPNITQTSGGTGGSWGYGSTASVGTLTQQSPNSVSSTTTVLKLDARL